MTRKLKYKNITWLDLTSPTKEEVDEVVKDYHLHALIGEELAGPSVRARVDVYDDFLYLILHFPSAKVGDGEETDSDGVQEVDFIVGHDFLITTHYETIEAMNEFAQIFESQLDFGRPGKELHAGHLFYAISRQIYRSLEEGLLSINKKLKTTEKNIFTGKEREMVTILAQINRNLLDFRWTLKSHREILRSLDLAGREFFGEKFAYFLHAISGEYEKIWNMLESDRETFIELRQTNESLLTIKTAEITKTLAIVASVFLPLSLIGQIFGISSNYLPVVNQPDGFWIVLIMMIVATIFTVSLFKYKKWL